MAISKTNVSPSIPRGPAGRRLNLPLGVKAALVRKSRAQSAIQTRQTHLVQSMLARLGL